MVGDAAASCPATAAVKEAANGQVVEEATTEGKPNHLHPATMDDESSTSGGDVVALNGKRQRDEACVSMPGDEREEKRVKKTDEPAAPSGRLLARRAGFVAHLTIRVPEYKHRHICFDCEST
ncbi:hypothetical protein PVAP13_9NG761600 [Panicum virgatum]|jgi:hypothetical protein|uniref:Uncharacterized protein n=1 Tax=Panicum virgatum TaxID=38727 RepID=A0A8T0N438_PANVG|nr:hypothetical protein PVAP13_9NG761600 [Panicum virgatum]